eukprot:TRINITY_DN2615_c0_g1_i11.p1 TRINITY_DN2615_c0_g1~~TRINITY_DN2615_c0_g1_i11.p1  ORF type:complete len:313 (+),score=64.63 TRINITY_DN2615_c0_g1_i11:155-1093(+)
MCIRDRIKRINKREMALGSTDASWHDAYKDSAYIFAGNMPYELSEGDVITIFSQYGQVTDINLIRDEETGKSKGYAFLKYYNQKSTVLAVDNFNGTKILGRVIRVDHVEQYRQPEEKEDDHPAGNPNKIKVGKKKGVDGKKWKHDMMEDGEPQGDSFADRRGPADPDEEWERRLMESAVAGDEDMADKSNKKSKKDKKAKKDKKTKKDKKDKEPAPAPPSDRAPSPPRDRSPSPRRHRSRSPRRHRSRSPRRHRSRSPRRHRSRSPRRHRSRSPMVAPRPPSHPPPPALVEKKNRDLHESKLSLLDDLMKTI